MYICNVTVKQIINLKIYTMKKILIIAVLALSFGAYAQVDPTFVKDGEMDSGKCSMKKEIKLLWVIMRTVLELENGYSGKVM